MASNGKNMISVGFEVVDGADGLKNLKIDADSLSKALNGTFKQADALKKNFATFSTISVGINQLQGVFSSMQASIKGLTDAYTAQIEAETQLATNMLNSMAIQHRLKVP